MQRYVLKLTREHSIHKSDITHFSCYICTSFNKHLKIILPIASDPESSVAGQLCEREATPTTDYRKQQSDGKVSWLKNTPHDRETGLIHWKLHWKNQDMYMYMKIHFVYFLRPIPNLTGNHPTNITYNTNNITNITYYK